MLQKQGPSPSVQQIACGLARAVYGILVEQVLHLRMIIITVVITYMIMMMIVMLLGIMVTTQQ